MRSLSALLLLSPLATLLAGATPGEEPYTTPMASTTSAVGYPSPSPSPASSSSVCTPVKYSEKPRPTPGPPLNLPVPPPVGTVFSYEQPALPELQAIRDPSSWAVSPQSEWDAKTCHYNFTLQYAAGAPDGFMRRLSTINGQFPGPLIEANVGDWVEVYVKNELDEPQALHWHGIRQEGTAFMDGPPGISQCPIPPGGSFTYRFKATSFGTYWYHSHYGATMADGLYGALVVRSPADPITEYDREEILFVSDYYDDQSHTIVSGLRGSGYRGMPIPAMPDAVLINGAGQTNCSRAQPGVSCASDVAQHSVTAASGERLKLRLVNPGSEAMIRFSIDGHVLHVVEVDDTCIEPIAMHELSISSGQRYSVVVALDQPGAAYWMRARIAAACVLQGAPLETRAALHYADRAWAQPASEPWADRKDDKAPCVDIDNEHAVVPLAPEPLPAPVAWGRMDSAAGRFVDPETGANFVGFGFDNVTYTNYIQDPVLTQVQEGRPLNGSHFAHLTFDGEGSADLLLNQLDAGIAHPFHLHGRPFAIVARGTGNMTLADLEGVPLNNANPLVRDTILLPTASWALLRIPLDDPGVWAIHCHLGWHLAAGKLAIIVVKPDEIRKQQPPHEWYGLCNGNKNEIGPARRDYAPPQARGDGRSRM